MYVDVLAAITDSGNNIVDYVDQRRLRLDFLGVAPGTMTAGLAIDDPRFNHVNPAKSNGYWKTTGAASPVGTASSMGGPNPVLSHATAPADFAGVGGTPWVYWANAPLKTTGELGMQAYNPSNAWTTIALLGPNAAKAPVLDRFFISSNTHARININTWRDPVLITAFNNCPASGYPGQNMTPISSGVRDSIASTIKAATTASPFKNLSDFSQVSATIGGLNALDSEGVIRDTAEILCVRQQVFTILVAGQSLSDAGAVMGEQRGLAVVWRDPYADSTGYHPSFVRSFRWLTE
jgi:hypothetical protein